MNKAPISFKQRLYRTKRRLRKGRHNVKSADRWDREYQQGKWQVLNSMDELSRYMIIAGYIQSFKEHQTILDLGCGQGRLIQLLAPYGYSKYVGVDISVEAIQQAQAQQFTNAQFAAADITKWQTADQFDIIIFNEVVYYLPDPLKVFLEACQWLGNDGLFIVSTVRHGQNANTWTAIEPYFTTIHTTTVTNNRQQCSDIRVLQPSHA